jgi:hypothetical protein
MILEKLQLSNYFRPEIKEVASKDFVLNGDKNSFYQEIIDRYNGSPTNRAIIDAYSQFIYGKGLTSKQQAIKPIQFATVVSIISKKDLKNICHDFELFGEASAEIIFDKGKLKQIKHVPKNTIAPNKMNEDGDINLYWYSRNFADTRKYEPLPIDALDLTKIPKSGSAIYIFKDYQVGKNYYSDPSYISSLPYSKLEEEIGNFCVKHIQNGLSFGHIININDGADRTDEQKRETMASYRENLAGSNNSNSFVLAYNDNKENAITIETLEVNEAHKQYEFLSSEATQKIMLSHRVVSPILFGIKDNTGFGNNADEMQVAFDELMINVIQPKKETILDGLMEIFNACGISIDLDFIPLRTKAVEVQPTQLSAQSNHEHTDDILADELVVLGESIDLDEWELIDSRESDNDDPITETSFKLAYAPSNFPERDSEQDTTLFKIRYSYAGNPNPEREFCRKMMQANLMYRKEDIIAAGNKSVNKGFGPEGADKYSIWLYKGGARCRHFFMRNIYIKKNNDKISAKKARELLNELDPSLRKEANFEQNDALVAKMPNDMPNNGYLKPQN